jgi:hypothetical protein
MKKQFLGILDCPGWYGSWTIQSEEKSEDIWNAFSDFLVGINGKKVSRSAEEHLYLLKVDKNSLYEFSYIPCRHPNLALKNHEPFSLVREIEGVLHRLNGKTVQVRISETDFEIRMFEEKK